MIINYIQYNEQQPEHPDRTEQDDYDAKRSRIIKKNQDIINKSRRRNTRKPKKPPLYKILIEDNDVTPHIYVFQVVREVFQFPEKQIWDIILNAEKNGECLVVILPKEIAETKVEEANDYAKSIEHDELIFKCEPDRDENDDK